MLITRYQEDGRSPYQEEENNCELPDKKKDSEKNKQEYIYLLKTGLGILDFQHFDWLNGARLSAHIPAVTKYGQ